MTVSELKRRIRRLSYHLSKRKRAKWSDELTKKIAGSFKHEPHPYFMDQPN